MTRSHECQNTSPVLDESSSFEKTNYDRRCKIEVLKILSWNIGFGRQGEVPHTPLRLVRSLTGIDRKRVARTAERMGSVLATSEANVIALQETCNSGILSAWTSTRWYLSSRLNRYGEYYVPDCSCCLAPGICFFNHGMSTYYQSEPIEKTKIDLLQVHIMNFFALLKRSTAQNIRFSESTTGMRLSVLNVHLSAFENRAGAKYRQIGEVIDWAEMEYERGYHVVVCGDFNYDFLSNDYGPEEGTEINRTKSFPVEMIPKNWRVVPDLESAKSSDEIQQVETNFNGKLVDGFLLSPNLTLERFQVIVADSSLSDHPALCATISVGQ